MGFRQITAYIGLWLMLYQGGLHAAPIDFLKAKQLLQSQQSRVNEPDTAQEITTTPVLCTTSDPGSDHGAHPLWFHSSVHATIWFEGWHTMAWEELFGSCIAIVIIAALYEGFKVFRGYIYKKQFGSTKAKETVAQESTTGNSTDMIVTEKDTKSAKWWSPMFECSHLIQGLLHMVQVCLSLCIMLVFMTYNIWLCLSVVLGAGLGYYLFAWKKNILDDEVCCN